MPLKGAAAPFLTTPPPAAEYRCLLLGVPGGTRRAPQPDSFLSFFPGNTLVSRNDSAVVNLQHNVQYVHVRHIAQNAKFYFFFFLTQSFCSAYMLVFLAAMPKLRRMFLTTIPWTPIIVIFKTWRTVVEG